MAIIDNNTDNLVKLRDDLTCLESYFNDEIKRTKSTIRNLEEEIAFLKYQMDQGPILTERIQKEFKKELIKNKILFPTFNDFLCGLPGSKEFLDEISEFADYRFTTEFNLWWGLNG